MWWPRLFEVADYADSRGITIETAVQELVNHGLSTLAYVSEPRHETYAEIAATYNEIVNARAD